MMDKVVAVDTCAIIHLMCISRFSLFENLKYSCFTTKFVQLEFDNKYEETHKGFEMLVKNKKISLVPLEINDLVEMANFPESRNASNAELSCFILSKRFGCKTMTNDERSIKFALNRIGIDSKYIIRMLDLLLEAYFEFILCDSDLYDIQEKLSNNKFKFHTDLVFEAARRRYVLNNKAIVDGL
jgi:hypothetical protein